MTFNAERDGWSLRDAIMGTSNPLLASVAQKRLELGKQPRWWVSKLAPEPLPARRIEYDVYPERDYELTVEAVERAFRIKLINGEMVCWARPGAPHEEHIKLAAGTWGALLVEDWIFGTLVACTRDARLDFVPVQGGPRYYDSRIVKPGLLLTERDKGGRPGFPYRDRAIEAAVEYLYDEGGEEDKNAVTLVTKFLSEWVGQRDREGGPEETTLRDWARKAIIRRRQERAVGN